MARNESFELQPGVRMWGAFPGCGSPDPNEHDIALYATILSGDLAGDDIAPELLQGKISPDNSLHVVRCRASQVELTTKLGASYFNSTFQNNSATWGGLWSAKTAPISVSRGAIFGETRR